MRLFALLALLLSAPAEARVGETPEECARRCGDPVRKTEKSHLFLKDGLEIEGRFCKGYGMMLKIRKKEGSLSREEMESLRREYAPEAELIRYGPANAGLWHVGSCLHPGAEGGQREGEASAHHHAPGEKKGTHIAKDMSRCLHPADER